MKSNLPVIDEQILIGLVGEDSEELRSIYADFVEDLKQGCPKLVNAVHKKDAEAIRQGAHYLKTSSSGVGAMRLNLVLTEIEKTSKNPEGHEFNTAISHLKESVMEVLAEIRILIKKYE
ncbi:Hpt domain-containing protein [Planctobacterium marinum]|uniref:Hpt domain-containing protein n=1 Tax=Planctobacterium marinum TaxID=1631968 RepID=UPI001E4A7039|nr:Hpt domain-containing protein [Planctobacterium marinum]MCC2607085.1 Hpt domain-containing protein [Planctobacterium marinum]